MNMSWEQRAVDEIIAKENRRMEIYREIEYLEHCAFEVLLYGDGATWYFDKIEDLESELSDLQDD